MKILLIGNYPRDKQRSMLRYSGLLEEGLKKHSVSVEIFTPPVFFGRFFDTTKGAGKWLGYIDKYLLASLQLWLKRVFRKTFDVAHICDHSNAHYLFVLMGLPHTITCHDMLAVRSAKGEFPENSVGFFGRIQQSIILSGLKRSKNLTCVSKATSSDFCRLVGRVEPVTIIPNAIHPKLLTDTQRITKRPDSPYLLHVGSDAWYKNRLAVLKIFKELVRRDPKLTLRIVGPNFSDSDLQKTGTETLLPQIRYFSNLSDEDLAEIYAGAELLLFPSLIEGFGWPILEAQARGTPVLTSASFPMAELNALEELRIAGDPITEAWQKDAATAAFRVLGNGEKFRNQLLEHCTNYSIDKVVQAHLANYESILNSNG